MSCKLPLNNNSFRGNCDPVHWGKVPSSDGNVKFAGDEAKDRLYEPKHQKKLVRVLTVVAYIFFVSLAAIMLSLYYVFIWNGHPKENTKLKTVVVPVPTKCEHDTYDLQDSDPTMDYEKDSSPFPTIIPEVNSTWMSDFYDFDVLQKRSVFLEKLFRSTKFKA